jgi:hypothetical protein
VERRSGEVTKRRRVLLKVFGKRDEDLQTSHRTPECQPYTVCGGNVGADVTGKFPMSVMDAQREARVSGDNLERRIDRAQAAQPTDD